MGEHELCIHLVYTREGDISETARLVAKLSSDGAVCHYGPHTIVRSGRYPQRHSPEEGEERAREEYSKISKHRPGLTTPELRLWIMV